MPCLSCYHYRYRPFSSATQLEPTEDYEQSDEEEVEATVIPGPKHPFRVFAEEQIQKLGKSIQSDEKQNLEMRQKWRSLSADDKDSYVKLCEQRNQENQHT